MSFSSAAKVKKNLSLNSGTPEKSFDFQEKRRKGGGGVLWILNKKLTKNINHVPMLFCRLLCSTRPPVQVVFDKRDSNLQKGTRKSFKMWLIGVDVRMPKNNFYNLDTSDMFKV